MLFGLFGSKNFPFLSWINSVNLCTESHEQKRWPFMTIVENKIYWILLWEIAGQFLRAEEEEDEEEEEEKMFF